MQTLNERWYKDAYEKLRAKFSHAYTPPDEFRIRLKSAIQQSMTDLVQTGYRKYPEHAKIFDELLQKSDAQQSTILANLETEYRRLYHEHMEYINARRQESVANLWDHGMGFVWTFLKGLSVVFLILLTGFLSDKLEIPIPLLRIPL